MRLLEALSGILESVQKIFSSTVDIPKEFNDVLRAGGKKPIGSIEEVKRAFQMRGVDFGPIGVAVRENSTLLYMGCMRFFGEMMLKEPEVELDSPRDKYGIPDYNRAGILLAAEESQIYIESIFLKSELRETGDLRGFLSRQCDLHIGIGMKKISLEAAFVGRYTWYAIGFRPKQEDVLVNHLYASLLDYVPWVSVKKDGSERQPPTTLGEFLALKVNRRSFAKWLDKDAKAAKETHPEFLADRRFLARGEDGELAFRIGKYFIIYHKFSSNWKTEMSLTELKARVSGGK